MVSLFLCLRETCQLPICRIIPFALPRAVTDSPFLYLCILVSTSGALCPSVGHLVLLHCWSNLKSLNDTHYWAFFHANLTSVYLLWYTDVMPVFILWSFIAVFIWGGRVGSSLKLGCMQPRQYLNLLILLPPYPKCRAYRSAPPHMGCWV